MKHTIKLLDLLLASAIALPLNPGCGDKGAAEA